MLGQSLTTSGVKCLLPVGTLPSLLPLWPLLLFTPWVNKGCCKYHLLIATTEYRTLWPIGMPSFSTECKRGFLPVWTPGQVISIVRHATTIFLNTSLHLWKLFTFKNKFTGIQFLFSLTVSLLLYLSYAVLSWVARKGWNSSLCCPQCWASYLDCTTQSSSISCV